ncbi:hypothetical protein [Amycolatopsis sp. lyj-109]|uniref:hypothetical protein n=1 Tax=Amycolatopsis sp. lyj-109 TaxID=2789287 RepID=UPI00397D3ABD
MPDFARSVTGSAGYRVPVDDPSVRGVHATEMRVLQARLDQAAGGGAGGFRLDVEQMQALLPQWKDLRDTLEQARQLGNDLQQVKSPATDESSLSNNRAALKHAVLYQRTIMDQWAYVDGYVRSLEKMIEKYQAADHSAGHSFNVMGTDL